MGFTGGSGRRVGEGAFPFARVGQERGRADHDDAISLTSSDPAASALLGYAQEEQEMAEGEEVETELSQISCPAYKELLEVMERATVRLDLGANQDERYLSGHKRPVRVSLLFLPDFHTEVEKEWKKPFSSRIHRFQHTSYANIEKMLERCIYEKMPPVEETLASYLFMGRTTSLKVPSLPSKPLQDTSRLNGKAYAAAGQVVASLHTMAVLHADQADLLKDLDNGQGLSPDQVAELRGTTDLALRATKQAATAMGRSMAAMVVTEKHLWVNLADPVSPSKLFGTSVETVLEKFREARARSAAFKTFIPRRSRSEPEQSRGPGSSWSEDQRRAQKANVATRAPRPPTGRDRGRYRSKRGRQDLRKVIQTEHPQQRSHLDQSKD